MGIGKISVFPMVLAVVACVGCQVDGPAPNPTDRVPQAAETPAARGERPQDRDQVDEDGIVRRGDALSARHTMTVGAVIKKASALDGQLVKVQGEVGRVCGKSGCWFELRGNDQAKGIRITSKGYRFFVPSKATGMRATLEGDLKVRQLDVAAAQHFADDEAEGSGRPAAKVTEPVTEISIAAIGLEMTKAQSDG